MSRSQFVVPCVVVTLLLGTAALAEDVVELTTGAKIRGRIVSQDSDKIAVEVLVGGKPFTRSYPAKQVRNVIKDGEQVTAPTTAIATRSKSEVLQIIARDGKSDPDWLASTKLSFPETLDLEWPQPAPKGWNGAKNIGQFIWDRINPNEGQWRNGIKFMYYMMDLKKNDKEVFQRSMLTLGGMYHRFLSDYARSAYWLQRAGVEQSPDEHPNATLQLADCYYRLGSKPMAMALLQQMRRIPPSAIKILGDIGETKSALELAERYAKESNPVLCYLYAGDVCRVAAKLDEAESYYRKALAAAERDTRTNDHAKRDRARAEASLAAIEFYKLSPRDLKDGEYRASSIGYEDAVEVSVTIATGRIEKVEVTNHREKQFYSSIADTPPRIIAKQGVRNVDAVAGATITSEAIINATAKALAQGR